MPALLRMQRTEGRGHWGVPVHDPGLQTCLSTRSGHRRRQDNEALAPIDVHAHVFKNDPAFAAMLKRLKLRILDVCVVDKHDRGYEEATPQNQKAQEIMHSSTRQDPLHAQAQLRRQLSNLATHFRPQHQKYARNTQLIPCAVSISSALPNAPFALPECSLQRDALAENKALLSWAVNEWVACSKVDRGAKSLVYNDLNPYRFDI